MTTSLKTELTLKALKPSQLGSHAVSLVMAPHADGKSTLVADLIHKRQLSPGTWCDATPVTFLPELFQYIGLNLEVVPAIVERQRQIGLHGGELAFLVVENCQIEDQWTSPLLAKVFHPVPLLTFFSFAYTDHHLQWNKPYRPLEHLPPRLCNRFDFVFARHTPLEEDRHQLHNLFFDFLPLPTFSQLLQQCSQDHCWLVLSLSDKQLYWYRASEPPDRIAQSLWRFAEQVQHTSN